MGPREFYEEIDSTQDRALALARSGAPVGTRVVAQRQRRGRGRLDHAWASPAGGLYVSVVVRTAVERVSWFPIALGARLASELEALAPLALAVKWPNDLLVLSGDRPARKLAGVLVDRVEDASGDPVEVAGIGINVTTDLAALPAELRARSATLAEGTGGPPSLAAVEEAAVRSALATASELGGRFSEIRALCERRLFGVGRRASVDGVPAGTIEGLGADGELLLRHGSDVVAIRTGDVRVDGVA